MVAVVVPVVVLVVVVVVDVEPVVVVTHAPAVSPWRRCAGTALALTTIVWNGYFFECVRWQTASFPYWDWAAVTEFPARPTPPSTPAAARATAPTATPATVLLR